MIRIQSFTEVGGHRVNEDAFLVQSHPQEPDCWLCLLADGQGGQSGGGPAARIACQTALDFALRSRAYTLLDPRTWMDVLRQADLAVAKEPSAGFTTLVGLCVFQNMVVGVSNGDSAALLIVDGTARVLTADQEKNPPVGSGSSFGIGFSAITNEPWRLLVMSDGVWKYVGWERVVEIASRVESSAMIAALEAIARLPGSGRFQDDFTVVRLEGLSE